MAIRAQLFDGTILEFPDGTSQEVINRVAKEQTLLRRPPAPEPTAPAPLPERGLASIAFDALKRGGYQTGMLLGDVLPAMVGRAIGADEYANRQLAEAAETQKMIQRELPQAVASYTDISGVGDAVKYVVEAVGENLVSILPSIFTGGAATVLTAGARTAAIKAAEKKAVEEVTKAAAKNVLTQETLDGIGKAALDVGIKEAQKIAAKAQIGGALAGSALQNIPEVYQNVLEETGKESLGAALLFGGLNSALDTVTPALLLRKISNAGLSTDEIGKAWYKRFGKGLAQGFVSEGATETAQEMSSAAAEKFIDENKEFFTQKNLERFINAGLKGGLGGGIITGATDVVTGKSPEAPQKKSDENEIYRRQQELLGLVAEDKLASQQEAEEEAKRQKALAEQFKPLAQNDLLDMAPANLYLYIESLKQRPATAEVRAEIKNASEILAAKEREEIQRRQSPTELTQKILGEYKIPRNSNLYNELVGKNLGSSEDIVAVRETLNIYKGMIENDQAPKALLPKIDRMLADLDRFEANLPYGRGAYVEPTVQPATGEGAPVAEQPAAGATPAGTGVTEPSGVVPPVAPVGEPPVGEGAVPAPVAAPKPAQAPTPKIEAPVETPAITALPTFKIVKTEVADESGKTQSAWNVVDAKDGRIFDTFNKRKEAQAWVNDAKQKAATPVQAPTPAAPAPVAAPAPAAQATAPAPALTPAPPPATSAAPSVGEVVSVPKTDRDAVEQHAVKGYPIVEAPVNQITLSKDVPQFKSDADIKGIVKPLEGKFERIGVAPIQLWKRTDGRLEVISGRHRFDLAQRSGETTIPAQIHEESAGFTPAMAATLDAELNIRDEQGEVKDYVVYFEKSGISQQEAKSRGLLGRTVGQRGWSIASQGSPDLIAAHRAGIVPDDAAAGISSLAPGDARLQALGIREIQKDKSTPAVLNTIQAYKTITADRAPVDTGGDLFGFDDSALKEAEDMARIATDKQREISSRLSAITGAAKKPEVAKKEGIDIRDEKALNKRIEELRKTKAAWNNWANSPELVNEIRAEMQPKEEPKGKPSLAERPEEEVDQEEATEKQPEEKAPSKEERRAVIEQKMAELEALLKKSLSKFGLKDIGFKLSTDLKASGLYAENLITLALDASNPLQDLRHEAIHALKELGFFSDSQWNALVREAKGKWINKFLKERNINKGLLEEDQKSRYDAYIEYYTKQGLSEAEIEQVIIEEAIADAFAEFDSTKPPPGLMQAILTRLRNFFSGVKDAANEAGFTEAEQIFGKVERGELAPGQIEKEKPAKPSLRDEGEIKLDMSARRAKEEPARDWISKVYEGLPRNPMNPAQRAMMFGDEQFALIELGTSGINPGGVEIKWIQAYPNRAGVGTKAIRELQRLAANDNIALDLFPWNKGRVSQAKLIKFYKSVGFQPTAPGSKNMIWRPEGVSRPSLRAPETEAFKRWFGDSKVVDENGQPLVVYHGTTKDFDAFNTNPKNEMGAHFGTSVQAASFGEKEKGRIIPVFLSIKNPYESQVDLGVWANVNNWKEYLYNWEADGNGPIDPTDAEIEALKTPADVRKLLESRGFDGIEYYNQIEGEFDEFGDGRAANNRAFIAFHPEQIKSATGNIGTYDITKPDIRASLRNFDEKREPTQEDAKAFWRDAEKVTRSRGVEAAEEAWIGGIADFGDPKAAQDIQLMPGYNNYQGELIDLARQHLAKGNGKFYVYRYGNLNLRSEILLSNQSGDLEPKATTLSINFAKAFKNFAGFDEERDPDADMGWMRIAVHPEAILMVGKPEENELVIDTNNIFPQDIEIIDESFQPVSPESRFSLRDATEDDRRRSLNDKRVSPRLPTAVKATEDPLGKVRLQPDLETFKRDPAAFRHNIGLMSKYPNFANVKGTPDQRAEQMIEHMKENLLWLFNQWDKKLRDRSKLWYVGGNRIAHRWAEKYSIPPEQAAAIIAALSPQKDWFQNVSLAERTLDALVFNADTAWTPEMTKVFRERAWAKKFPLRKFRDKTLKEMYIPGDAKSLVNMAVWIRAWDEATNPQTARVITPEGNFSEEVASGKTGKPIAMRAQSFAAMVKTLQMMQQTDLGVISDLIGKNHKVRSFYNNIIAPYAGDDVTIDTHAVAAALMRPLGSSDLEVYHNFGSAKPAKKDKEGNILIPASPGTKNSAITGLYGTYAMYAEAYRRAAQEAKVLPREMQSITWEAIRGLFRPEQKQAKLKQQTNVLWNKVSKGEVSGKNAREQISEMVSGITDPAWAKSPAGVDESRTDSSYATELPRTGVSGGRPAEPAGRTGKRVAGAVPRASLRDVEGVPTIGPKMDGTFLRRMENIRQQIGDAYISGEIGFEEFQKRYAATNEEYVNALFVQKKIDEAKPAAGLEEVFPGFVSIPNGTKILATSGLSYPEPTEATVVGSTDIRVGEKAYKFPVVDFGDGRERRLGYGDVKEVFAPRPVKASLRSTTNPAALARISQVTTTREEKTFVKRITDAIAPTARSKFRAAFINRYNRLSEYDKVRAEKMGGVALMADSSAESAALMSDLAAGVTASVLGVHNRKGGIPVYSKGFTTVLDTVEGPLSIFALLAKYGDPLIYQKYQYWSAVKRGLRLYREGREENITRADKRLADEILRDHPEFADIQKKWIKFNDGLVKYLVDTGVLSKEKAAEFTKYSDYIPFYRQIDGDENAIGPKIFQSISGVKAPKKLKGSEAPLGDFLETIVRNVQSSVQAGMKNVAAQRAAKVAMDIGMAARLNHVASGLDVFKVLENGKEVYYRSADPLFIDAIKSLNLGEVPFIGFLSGPANLLRNLVTKDPGFMLANMMRDSMAAWVTSGVKMTPIISTAGNFAKAIAGTSPEMQALLNAGILGGYEYSQGVKVSASKFGKELRKTAGKMTAAEMAARPATYLWEALEKGTLASDAATRMEIYKKTLAETGNEAEALYRAVEVMNFNRKGSSAVVRILTAAVPFLNARIQGLDVLYRAAFGEMATADAQKIQKAFFVRGMTIAALSCLYWALTHDDKEYEKQEQETRDNFWLIPSLGVRIPIPFEVGVIFKVIPERIMGVAFGDDTGRDFLKSMGRQITSTLAFNPIPQSVLPLFESTTNFSFFTMRPIIDQGMENIAPFAQVSPRTSKLSETVGKALKDLPTEFQISPMKLDQLINGYTGTLGMYMVDAFDAIYNMHTDSPKPSKRFEQLPIIKRFALDPEARGQVTAYYELKNKVDEVVRTSNLLERTMDYKGWGEYYKDNIKLLAVKDYILDMEKTMKELREMKNLVRVSSMSADAKRDAILSITKMENALNANTQHLKKSLAR